MKIRIEEPGYENLTGNMGQIEFVDGVSVNEFSHRQLNVLASTMRIVEAETGEQVGPNFDFAKTMHLEAVSSEINYAQPGEADATPKPEVYLKKAGEEKQEYTQQELEEIADKQGIGGLRAIADKLNVKANSIVGLIQKIAKG